MSTDAVKCHQSDAFDKNILMKNNEIFHMIPWTKLIV